MQFDANIVSSCYQRTAAVLCPETSYEDSVGHLFQRLRVS
jgi:hypothetical protein